MSDIQRGVALPERKDVTIPGAGGGSPPGVYARPVPVALPGAPNPDTSAAQSLLRALDLAENNTQALGSTLLKEDRQEQFKLGQMKQAESQEKFADAQAKGIIPQAANPWFVKGYQNQDGRVQAQDYEAQARAAYLNSPARGSDDPTVFQKWMGDFRKQYMAGLPQDRSPDWWDGFGQASTGADERLSREHAELTTQAAVAKQEANTGAELNTILNGTTDPKIAAERINALGARLKLEGMPEQSFAGVVAQSVIAKVKGGGSPALLDALNYVTVGGSPAKGAQDDNFAAANATLNLSPQEQALYQRHLTNLKGPGGVTNADGSRSTIRNITAEIDGRTYVVPTVYDGKIVSDDEAVTRAKAAGLQSFPSYATEAEAEKRYNAIHSFMEKDAASLSSGANAAGVPLASNPKIASALADTRQWVTEKARSDTRWAWAVQDHQITLINQQRANERYEWEKQERERSAAHWSREDKARSLMSTIQNSAITNPSSAYADAMDDLKALNSIDPQAARSTADWLHTFTDRQTRLSEDDMRPVVSDLNATIMGHAGNGAALQQDLQQANALYAGRKIDFAKWQATEALIGKMRTVDTSFSEKLKSPQVQAVHQAARSLLSKSNGLTEQLTGSDALTLLNANQAIDNAVGQFILAHPEATSDEVGKVARDTLQALAPTIAPEAFTGNSGSPGSLAALARQTDSAASRNGMAPPKVTKEEAYSRLAPEKRAVLLRLLHQELGKGMDAFAAAVAEIDKQTGIEGFGKYLIEQMDQQPPTKPANPSRK